MAGFGIFARAVCAAVLALGISIPAFAQEQPYSEYSFDRPHRIDISNCSSAGLLGCFGGASLSGLDGPCSILAGPTATVGNQAIQLLYVLQTGSDADPVVRLKIFRKTVTVKPSHIIAMAVTLQHTVDLLSLTGGSNLTCFMAANSTSIFLGTSAATHAVQLNKRTFARNRFGQGTPPALLTGITASEDGFVAIYFGDKKGSFNAAFYLFGPDGKEVSLGGASGPTFVPNQTNGVSLK